jgi:hypothetical protein
MARLLVLLLILLAIPWGARAWWEMRRARGPKERAFLGRTILGTWMCMVVTILLVYLLKGRALLFALPIMGVAGLALQHGWRKARARIQAEEADPLSRARPLN